MEHFINYNMLRNFRKKKFEILEWNFGIMRTFITSQDKSEKISIFRNFYDYFFLRNFFFANVCTILFIKKFCRINKFYYHVGK